MDNYSSTTLLDPSKVNGGYKSGYILLLLFTDKDCVT